MEQHGDRFGHEHFADFVAQLPPGSSDLVVTRGTRGAHALAEHCSTTLEPLDRAVLHKLLDGSHPVLSALRQQLDHLTVVDRELTGGGFFTNFRPRNSANSVNVPEGLSPFGDVEAAVPGLEHGAGFLLWLENGFIKSLEGFSYEEPWPATVEAFSLRYSDPHRVTLLSKLGSAAGKIVA